MRVVRVVKRPCSEVLSKLESKFERKPNLKLLRPAYQHAQRVSVNRWSAIAFTALFCRKYYDRYRRDWKGGEGLLIVHQTLRNFVARVGKQDARKAIEAIFSPQFHWVTGHLNALNNDNFFSSYLVPVMARAERKAGEQAEWTGEVTQQATYQQVYL